MVRILIVKICSYSAIDLVLMDVQTFHNHDGLSAGKIIREKYPYTKVLVVTSLIDPKVLERAKSGCADSLWYKDHGEEEFRDRKENGLFCFWGEMEFSGNDRQGGIQLQRGSDSSCTGK